MRASSGLPEPYGRRGRSVRNGWKADILHHAAAKLLFNILPPLARAIWRDDKNAILYSGRMWSA